MKSHWHDALEKSSPWEEKSQIAFLDVFFVFCFLAATDCDLIVVPVKSHAPSAGEFRPPRPQARRLNQGESQHCFTSKQHVTTGHEGDHSPPKIRSSQITEICRI